MRPFLARFVKQRNGAWIPPKRSYSVVRNMRQGGTCLNIKAEQRSKCRTLMERMRHCTEAMDGSSFCLLPAFTPGAAAVTSVTGSAYASVPSTQAGVLQGSSRGRLWEEGLQRCLLTAPHLHKPGPGDQNTPLFGVGLGRGSQGLGSQCLVVAGPCTGHYSFLLQ